MATPESENPILPIPLPAQIHAAFRAIVDVSDYRSPEGVARDLIMEFVVEQLRDAAKEAVLAEVGIANLA